MKYLRLGINIDHVATVRNARGGLHPDPVRAAHLAAEAGADGITAHLREDRRHIRDADIERLMHEIKLPLNFEMAATQEMQSIALKVKPHAACIVPEKRQEVTTEGGLDVIGGLKYLKEYIKPLRDAGIRVSLFVDPVEAQIMAAAEAGAQVVELHTGKYCEVYEEAFISGVLRGYTEEAQSTTSRGNPGGTGMGEAFPPYLKYLKQIQQAARAASQAGLECHAGHGLSFASVGPVAAIPQVVELNIGHFIIGEAIFIGLKECIGKMRHLMQEARK